MMKKLISVIIILLLAISMFYLINPFAAEEVAEEENRFEVEETKETLRAIGTIKPKRSIDLNTKRNETILETNIEEGSRVDAGDILFSYDDTKINLQLQQAKSELEGAKARVEQARKGIAEAELTLQLTELQKEIAGEANLDLLLTEQKQAKLELKQIKEELERLEKLYKQKKIAEVEFSEQEYRYQAAELSNKLLAQQISETENDYNNRKEEAELEVQRANTLVELAEQEYQQAKKALEATQIEYKQVELDLKDYQVAAPKSGMVVSKDITSGENVQAGEPALTIVSEKKLIKISPDEKEIGLLDVGTTGYASLEAYPEEKYEVKIISQGSQVDSQRGTIDIYLEFKEEVKNLVPNMAVSVELEK